MRSKVWPAVFLGLLLAAAAYPRGNGDEPNPLKAQRIRERMNLLESQRFQARPDERTEAALAAAVKTGTDRVLVILVEFGGPDTFLFVLAGADKSTWDPINKPDPSEWAGAVGDCSGITQANNIQGPTEFTYNGPLHNQIERPRGAAAPWGETIWAEDFDSAHYQSLIFGEGLKYKIGRAHV